MGNDQNYQVIFDRLVLDACQVTNPSIDPLREPMELRTFLGRKPDRVDVTTGADGVDLVTRLEPNLEIAVPVVFAPMSYGSISLPAQQSIAIAAAELGAFWNTGEGGLHISLRPYAHRAVVPCASGRFGVHADYLRAGADIIYLDGFRDGTGAAPTVIRDHLGIPIEIAIAVVDSRLREEGIRNQASLIAAGGIRSSADLAKTIALGADAVAIGTAALLALGCTLCQKCYTGRCSWGITTQDPELTRRIDPEIGGERIANLVRAWSAELEKILGALGVNSIESLRGSR